MRKEEREWQVQQTKWGRAWELVWLIVGASLTVVVSWFAK